MSLSVRFKTFIENIDYDRSRVLPAILACTPILSLFVAKIKTEQYQARVFSEWQNRDVIAINTDPNANRYEIFEESSSVRDYHRIRKTEAIGIIVQMIAFGIGGLLANNQKTGLFLISCSQLVMLAAHNFNRSRYPIINWGNSNLIQVRFV